MLPERVASKRREWLRCVSHEAPCSVCIHREKEYYEKVMSIPECFIRLLTDLLVRSRIHQEHAEQHDMAGDAACLGIVYLNGGFGSDLVSFDVEKAKLISPSDRQISTESTYLT